LVRPCPASRLSFSFLLILILTLTAGCGGGGGASSGGDDPPPSTSAPTIDSILPAAGSEHGGTPVKILGDDFSSGMQLTIGGLALECMHVLDPSTVVGVTPTGLKGSADVKAANSKGSDKLESGFEFQAAPWELLGMQGGEVTALAVDPSDPGVMYMGTEAGLLKSTSGGKQWSPLLESVDDENFYRTPLKSILIDPAATSTIYAGSSVYILKSMDAGATWTKTSGKGADCLAFDPSDSNVLYAGGFGVKKSLDAGKSWERIDSGFDSTQITAVVVDPFKPDTVFAGALGGGVYRSLDAGVTWVRVDSGFVSDMVYCMATDSTVSGRVFAGTVQGLQESLDSGETWTLAESGCSTGVIFSVAPDPSSLGTVYAGGVDGLYKRSASDLSWSRIDSGFVGPNVHTIDFASGSMLVGTTEELQRSDDSGLTWTQLDAVRSTPFVKDICADPLNSDTHYSCSLYTVQKSTDGGQSWTRIADADTLDLVWVRFESVTVNPANGDVLLASNWGVFKSTDSGASWVHLMVSVTSRVAINPLDSSVIYAATNSGVQKSVDSGATWAVLNSGITGSAYEVALDPGAPDTVYAGAGDGFHISMDGGDSWAQADESFGGYAVIKIAVDPLQSQTLYVGTWGSGLFKSTDMGGSWNRIDEGFSSSTVMDIAINPQYPSILYAAAPYAFMSSSDGGMNWIKVFDVMEDKDVLGSYFLWALAIDPLNPDTLYLGTSGGLIKTTTAGL
jgi:photosystem II stability/assembly factor-like uncharacterized protein